MLDSSDHLSHYIGSVTLSELFGNNAVKELSTLAVLHNDVHIAIIDVTLFKFDNVRMVHLL